MTLDRTLPSHIGPYRILGRLGAGSMGEVWLAEQDQPRREVAIKLSRGGGLDDSARRRFEREARLLGTLEHPDIARLYGVGFLDEPEHNRPYLVMERVRGQPLVAATQGWTSTAKLQLLARLARAVHYAHSRGVVHRDLKPANLLVTADGAPKVLDFGVARARDDSGEQSRVTRLGEVVGTLPYMAWEQLSGSADATDPRVDVYALGVIAYELLAGQRPYPNLPSNSVAAAMEVLRTREPDALAAVAPDCAGDIDTIVMKALAREPARRYDSALALASDLDRFLDGRPIEARPPTALYVAGLFVRRHRALAAAALLSVLALGLAAVIATTAALRERSARAAAELRAAQLDASTRFLEDILTSADPERAQGREMSVRELLDLARANLDGDTGMAPAVRALAARAIGMSYAQLGDTATGLRLLDAAQAALLASGGPLTGDRYSEQKLALTRAEVLVAAGRYEDALNTLAPLLEGPVPDEELALRQRLEAEQTALVAHGNLGHSQQALDLGRATARIAGERLGTTDKATLISRLNVATMQMYTGELAEARAGFDALLPDLERGYGPRHPFTLIARQNRANVLRDSGDLPGARAALRAVVADMSAVLGADHYTTLSARLALGRALAQDAATRSEATTQLRAVYTQYRLQRGPAAQATLATATSLAATLADDGHADQAEAMYREILAAQPAAGGDTADRLAPLHEIARLHRRAGQLALAIRELQALVQRALASEFLGPQHPATLAYQLTLGDSLLQAGQPAAAQVLLASASTAAEAKLGAAHPRTAALLEKLVAADEALHDDAQLAADRQRLDAAKAAQAAKAKR